MSAARDLLRTIHTILGADPTIGPAESAMRVVAERDALDARLAAVRALIDGQPDHGIVGVHRIRAALAQPPEVPP